MERRGAPRRRRMEPGTVLVILVALYAYTLAAVSARGKAPYEDTCDELFFVLLVPALNEEGVIGDTLTLEPPNAFSDLR